MAEQTNAEKAEAARRKALTPEARDAEDKAELDALDTQISEENEAKGRPAFTGDQAIQRRAALQKKVASRNAELYDAEATEEVTVARGRTIVSGLPHAQIESTQGMTPKVTPAEAVKLRQSGHIIRNDGTVQVEAGPKVYQDAGLLQGHATGQGAKPASK